MSSPFNLRKDAENKFKEQIEKLQENIESTTECLNSYANHFKTKHVMITAGADFAFVHADIHYKFLD